jgi:hypothetical protein
MTSNQYRVYYNGLHKRPTYEGLINYLANEQEIIQYPNRTATQMRNHPYLTQLDGDDYDQMTEQQLSIMRAKMNGDKINEEAAKPGGPGTNQLRAASAGSAAASSSSSGSSSYQSIASSSQASTPRRPFFLPPSGSAPLGIPPLGIPLRGSVVARPESYAMSPSQRSAASSQHLSDVGDLLRVQHSELTQLEKQDDERRIRDIKMIARQGLTGLAKTTEAGRIMSEQQPSASSSSAPAAQRSASSTERMRISGKQAPVSADVKSDTTVYDKLDFSAENKDTGGKIDDYLKYWKNKIRDKPGYEIQFTRRGLTYDNGKNIPELIAELVTYDRRLKGIDGIASVQDVYTKGTQGPAKKVIHIIYPKKQFISSRKWQLLIIFIVLKINE